MKRDTAQMLNQEIKSCDNAIRSIRTRKENWKAAKEHWPELPLDSANYSVTFSVGRLHNPNKELRIGATYYAKDVETANDLRRKIGHLLKINVWARKVAGGNSSEWKPEVRFVAMQRIPIGIGEHINFEISIDGAALAPSCRIEETKVMKEVTQYKTVCPDNAATSETVASVDQL